jgi:hypothetical protein
MSNDSFKALALAALVYSVAQSCAAEPNSVTAAPSPSPYSFAPTTLASLGRSITCHSRREFPRPGATGNCLTYTTAPAFAQGAPTQGIRLDPTRLVITAGSGAAEDLFSYPGQGIPKETKSILDRRKDECQGSPESSPFLQCLRENEKAVLSSVMPKQIVVVDLKTGESEGHSLLSFSRDENDSLYENYQLHSQHFQLLLSQLEPSSWLAFGLREERANPLPKQNVLSTRIDALEMRPGTQIFRIPRVAGWAAPQIGIVPFPVATQTSLEEPNTANNLAAQEFLVVLRSQAIEAQPTPAEVWCDAGPDYWLPTWTGLFLVRNDTWHLLFDEIKDLRSHLLTNISFVDLNQDGRRDIVLQRESDNDLIVLTSEDKAFRKWGEGEISPCGC